MENPKITNNIFTKHAIHFRLQDELEYFESLYPGETPLIKIQIIRQEGKINDWLHARMNNLELEINEKIISDFQLKPRRITKKRVRRVKSTKQVFERTSNAAPIDVELKLDHNENISHTKVIDTFTKTEETVSVEESYITPTKCAPTIIQHSNSLVDSGIFVVNMWNKSISTEFYNIVKPPNNLNKSLLMILNTDITLNISDYIEQIINQPIKDLNVINVTTMEHKEIELLKNENEILKKQLIECNKVIKQLSHHQIINNKEPKIINEEKDEVVENKIDKEFKNNIIQPKIENLNNEVDLGYHSDYGDSLNSSNMYVDDSD
jgi:hypothetical protein